MKVKSSAPRLEVKRGGRPVALQRLSPVTTWVPVSTHDRLIQVAKAQDKSISEVVRNVIILNIVNIYPTR